MFGIKSYTDEKGRLVKGWLNQIVESAKDCGYQEGAFFKPTLFACSSDKDFKKYEINERYSIWKALRHSKSSCSPILSMS